MIQEENSGLTIVHPVDRIKEVVEIEWERIAQQNRVSTDVNLPVSQEIKVEVAV